LSLPATLRGQERISSHLNPSVNILFGPCWIYMAGVELLNTANYGSNQMQRMWPGNEQHGKGVSGLRCRASFSTRPNTSGHPANHATRRCEIADFLGSSVQESKDSHLLHLCDGHHWNND
jgi:hypothetical protein